MGANLAWLMLAATAACRFVPGVAAAAGDGGAADARGDTVAPDAGADAAAMLGPWGEPTYLGVGTAGADDPTLTDDLLELYYNDAGDIYVARRASASGAWGAPVRVAELSSASTETTPEVSYDGLTMTLGSDRPGGAGSTDLWISTRTSRAAAWGAPVRFAQLNTPGSEAGAVMTPDQRAIVYSSNRPGGLDPDLYESTRASTADAWAAGTNLEALNTTSHEGSAFMTADGLTIYFDTDRAGGFGLDIYESHRTALDQPFPAPAPVAGLSSPSSDEQDPWVSSDGRHMFFYGNRNGVAGLWEASR